MSANLDLVRSIFGAWERGEWSSADWAHPEIEYVIAGGPQPGTWKGLAELAEAFRDFLGGMEEYRLEAEEYRELDDQRVLVLVHNHGRGKISGLDLGQVSRGGAAVFRMRDGKVTGVAFYWDREHAFADLGLAPEARS
jgi:ketosteroid isomerase-like protein